MYVIWVHIQQYVVIGYQCAFFFPWRKEKLILEQNSGLFATFKNRTVEEPLINRSEITSVEGKEYWHGLNMYF